jgi:CHAD domain-containing protein
LADAWHRRLRPGSPADLHELRKLLKAVRYLLEFFEPLVENAGLALRDAAIGVQTSLGVLQDVQVARQFVGSRLDHESVTIDIDVALGALAASAEEEAADAWVEFCNPDLRLPVFEELMRS